MTWRWLSALLLLTVLGTLACYSLLFVIDNIGRNPVAVARHRGRLLLGVFTVFTLLGFFVYQWLTTESQQVALYLLIGHSPLLYPAFVALGYIGSAPEFEVDEEQLDGMLPAAA